MLEEIRTAYAEADDMTFIIKETETSTEVIGFYWGEPDEEATKKFIGKLKAEY